MISTPLLWFLVGVAFLIAEWGAPGIILIFFSAGCWIVAITVWLFDIGFTAQIIIFIASSLILLFALRKYSLTIFRGKTVATVDDSYAEAKIGKTALVTKEISPNLPGEIKLMGSFWRAVADVKIAVDHPVVITKQESEDGLTFRVKPVKEEG